MALAQFRRTAAAALLALLAAGCRDDATGPVVRYEMALHGGDGQFATPGGTLDDPFQVLVTGATHQRAASGVRVTWRLLEGGSGAVVLSGSSVTDSAGVASATLRVGSALGEYRVRATVDRLVGTPPVFTARAVATPQVTAVAPTTVRAGDTVTVTGANFSPNAAENTVTFGGIRGTVVSAAGGSVRAVVPVCLPARVVPVVARLGAVASAPVSLTVQDAVSSVLQLEPGRGRTLAAQPETACTRLAVPASSAFFTVLQNAGDVAGALVPLQITSLVGGAAPGAFDVRTVQLDVEATSNEAREFAPAWEARLRQREAAIAPDMLVREAAGAATAGYVAPPQVGDRKQFYVVNKEDQFSRITAEVKLVSARAVIYQDVKAPEGGFTAQDFQEFGQLFDDPIYDAVTGAFGTPSDIDKNGLVTILFTPVINELTPRGSGSFIAGYFYGYDLTSESRSNRGEIFYSLVPDPQGKFGDARSKQRIFEAVPPVLAHELQHMVHFNQRVLQFKVEQEVLWLSEALAHHAEELVGNVLAARGQTVLARTFRFPNYVRALEYLRRPHAVSLVADVAPGSLAQRGGGWLLVKYVAEHFGGADVLRRLTSTTSSSVQNVAAATGRSWSSLFADWSIAIWADDAPELAGVALDPWHTIPNLDLRRELGGFTHPLNPTRLTLGDFAANASLAGSSSAYLLIEGGTAGGALNVSLTRKYGESLRAGEHAQLALLRIR